ncbi:MAG: recG [Candidatus Taylorbacteria bacterium]|nr:recG [Candidatus Taylorbacteria bacterium]
MRLHDSIESVTRLSFEQKQALKKLSLFTVGDLLRYYPVRYGDISKAVEINSVEKGIDVTVFGRIQNLTTSKGFKTKIAMAKATLVDETGTLGLVWFNQPYIAKLIHDNSLVRVEGKLSIGKSGRYFSNPKIEEIDKIPEIKGISLFAETQGDNASNHDAPLYPVYPETKNITSNWIFHTLQRVFKSDIFEYITDPIPESILKKYSLPTLKTALLWVHSPHKIEDYEIARKRLAFEEVFFIQLQKQIERKEILKLPSIQLKDAEEFALEFINKLPFKLTTAQKTVIDTITNEMKQGTPMSRLLEGDVGSGKTAVAGATAYAVVKSHPNGKDFGNYQIAYMAPTEILATQQFESFIEFFKHLPIEMALVIGATCKKFPSKVNPTGSTSVSKPQMLKWIEEGKISLVIGTHALIQKKVKFKNLAYVIIDEQHRFGVNQRQKLARKDKVIPHLLSMTATPIPRTLALTIYGDLDLSILDQMPAGRKQIITEIITPEKRNTVYEKIREELNNGRQAYIICPRIDAPDPDQEKSLQLRSVKEEAERLKKEVFREFKIDILHSKMTPIEKDKIMGEFYKGTIDILVSTSVVEVGVNVPNATVIVIEGAERFGLSQLHQLRGRVLRGNHQPYCFVFADSKNDKSIERLRAFKNAKNGFELAELDLKQRGSGGLAGGKQWGITDIAMEALRNLKMVEAARTEAKLIAETDLTLSKYPALKAVLESKKEIHFE